MGEKTSVMKCRFVWTQQMTYVTFTLVPVLIFSFVYLTNVKVNYEDMIANMTATNKKLSEKLQRTVEQVSVKGATVSENKQMVHKYETENKKVNELNRLL